MSFFIFEKQNDGLGKYKGFNILMLFFIALVFILWQFLTEFYSFWLCFLGLTAKVIDQTKTIADVYGAFFDFSCILKSKVQCFYQR